MKKDTSKEEKSERAAQTAMNAAAHWVYKIALTPSGGGAGRMVRGG